ncbi:hypothetical protein A3Q56_07765, partial [Intoshia linei]
LSFINIDEGEDTTGVTWKEEIEPDTCEIDNLATGNLELITLDKNNVNYRKIADIPSYEDIDADAKRINSFLKKVNQRQSIKVTTKTPSRESRKKSDIIGEIKPIQYKKLVHPKPFCLKEKSIISYKTMDTNELKQPLAVKPLLSRDVLKQTKNKKFKYDAYGSVIWTKPINIKRLPTNLIKLRHRVIQSPLKTSLYKSKNNNISSDEEIDDHTSKYQTFSEREIKKSLMIRQCSVFVTIYLQKIETLENHTVLKNELMEPNEGVTIYQGGLVKKCYKSIDSKNSQVFETYIKGNKLRPIQPDSSSPLAEVSAILNRVDSSNVSVGN